MNTQTQPIAPVSPPIAAIRAGPKLLAGLTEVPVKWIPKMCTSVRVSPMTIPARSFGLACDAEDREHEYEGEDDLDEQRQRNAAVVEAVRSEAAVKAEQDSDERRADDASQELSDKVADEVFDSHASRDEHRDRDGGIDVAA